MDARPAPNRIAGFPSPPRWSRLLCHGRTGSRKLGGTPQLVRVIVRDRTDAAQVSLHCRTRGRGAPPLVGRGSTDWRGRTSFNRDPSVGADDIIWRLAIAEYRRGVRGVQREDGSDQAIQGLCFWQCVGCIGAELGVASIFLSYDEWQIQTRRRGYGPSRRFSRADESYQTRG